jgi:uncharacterized Zn-binding protein involved in type VI secretion
MRSGSSFRLNGKDLTVTGDALLAGALVATGAERVVFYGSVDFTGGTLTQAQSTVVIGGQQRDDLERVRSTAGHA